VACGRDLAALEVSLALHEDHGGATEELLDSDAAVRLFDGTAPRGDEALPGALAPGIKNTLALISAVRQEALAEAKEEIYAVLLMDQALIQLGGLAFDSTQNRIRRPLEAGRLVTLLAAWLTRLRIIDE
jgi:hypothetical protein